MITVLEPGLLSTIQDGGRPALAHLGISPGGAADPRSYALGNALVGNRGGEAVLEMTLQGPTLRFDEDTIFALTGGDLDARLDGSPAALWRTCRARAGQTLALGAARRGARAYLAIAGGIDVPSLLGSRSALVGAGLGRALAAGDRLPVGPATPPPLPLGVRHRPSLVSPAEVAVLPGPEWSWLTDEARAALLGTDFIVGALSDRAGLRLAGPPLAFARYEEPLTEGVLWGTVQLPASGDPIVLMNDQQTTGGYPKIAQTILRDRPTLGQLKPGDRVRFRQVTPETALAEWREESERLRKGTVPL